MNIEEMTLDEKKEMRVSKIASLILGLLAILLGILFQNQNPQ